MVSEGGIAESEEPAPEAEAANPESETGEAS